MALVGAEATVVVAHHRVEEVHVDVLVHRLVALAALAGTLAALLRRSVRLIFEDL